MNIQTPYGIFHASIDICDFVLSDGAIVFYLVKIYIYIMHHVNVHIYINAFKKFILFDFLCALVVYPCARHRFAVNKRKIFKY